MTDIDLTSTPRGDRHVGELAAALARFGPCVEKTERWGRELADVLLDGGRVLILNYGAVLEHSWTLLTETERTVFEKLSVFRGGFRKGAGEGVVAAETVRCSGSKYWSSVYRSYARAPESGRTHRRPGRTRPRALALRYLTRRTAGR